MGAGRPTKYKPEYCQAMIDHFDQPLTYKTTEQKMSASGVVEDIEVTKPSYMPTFEGFAKEINVNVDTLKAWRDAHTDFSAAYKRCKGIQKQFLLSHGLTGGYNSSFAKFVAINCTDMVDRTEVKSENQHEIKGYGLAFDLSEKPEK